MSKRTRVLFDNTVLLHIEPVARVIGPPLLQFAFLIVHSSSGVERMLPSSTHSGYRLVHRDQTMY